MMNSGKTIRDYLRNNGITVDDFAKGIHRSRSAAYKILAANSISTSLLYDISFHLGHNFFHELSDHFDEITNKYITFVSCLT